MKRNLLTLLLVIICVPLIAQCELETQKFVGTGVTSRSTKPEQVGSVGKTGAIYFYLAEYTKENSPDKSMKLCVSITRLISRCFDADSKIQIKCGLDVIDLKFIGKTDCGTHLFTFAEISPEILKVLRVNLIESLNVYYTGEIDNFKVINSSYFFSTLKCF
jgi:hypothetical protein